MKKKTTEENIQDASELIADALNGKIVTGQEAMDLIQQKLDENEIELTEELDKALKQAIVRTNVKINKVHKLLCETFEMNDVYYEVAIHAMISLIASIVEQEDVTFDAIRQHLDHYERIIKQNG